MSSGNSSPQSSQDDVTADAQHLKAPPKGTKRRRSGKADAEEGSEAGRVATPGASPNKRQKKTSTSAAEGAAAEEAKAQKEQQKKDAAEAAEAEKLRKQEEKAALKAAKEKEREEKKARDAAEKKRKQEERAALKAAKDKERAEKKKVEDEAKKKKQEEKDQKKRWKQEWESYCAAHDVNGATLDWPEGTEPESITQTDAGKLYCLKPNEMGCLRHHPKVNFKYGNTTKLFDEDEVRALAFRKYAMLAGVTGSEKVMVTKGEALWEEEGETLGKGKKLVADGSNLESDVDQGFSGTKNVNWWRDPRYLRSMGHKSGTFPAANKSSKNTSDDEDLSENYEDC